MIYACRPADTVMLGESSTCASSSSSVYLGANLGKMCCYDPVRHMVHHVAMSTPLASVMISRCMLYKVRKSLCPW